MRSRALFEKTVLASPPVASTTRRRAIALAGAGLGTALLGGCTGDDRAAIDISGSSPALEFAMTRASDGRQVTQADYRGLIVMLYFGYTFCPDVCPTTLTNVADVLKRLGPDTERVRLLFVTVDPDRDTLPVLEEYVKNFAPQIDGLRGDADQIAALARRYRLAYSVTPATGGRPYEVTHGSAIYVFDATGAARLLIPSLGSTAGDVAGVTADLRRLAGETHRPGLLAWLSRLI
ncbi:MAG TPA: SCO family protein [Roseiarcus sp.]